MAAESSSGINFSRGVFHDNSGINFSFFFIKIHIALNKILFSIQKRGASNEYLQLMFLCRNKKNIYLIPSLNPCPAEPGYTLSLQTM